ncbi:MAG: hypothetical protein F6K23_38925 [Okeania sp. SIO2C9]|uniref:hypothetical protein n=1 Tax=Okeania sp. SIO2C9 TaxID=2607791 RepID=UPI0013BEDD82|nr:hypothetical protein [Okeania sp. SIO2C9]NEQ78445.1 hypothetical protein [Okeania sp. SIO2C9]
MKIEKKKSQRGKLTAKDKSLTLYHSNHHQTISAEKYLPPVIQGKLTALGQKFGLPFDLGKIDLTGNLAENVRALRKIAELAETNAKLLPEMLKLARKLCRAEIKEAQYYRAATKMALSHQTKIDKYSADIFLQLVQHEAKSSRLEYRTNQKAQLIKRRAEARRNYYQNTEYATEIELIDLEIENLEANNKLLKESKTKKLESTQQRKQKLLEYYNSAFEGGVYDFSPTSTEPQ